MKKSDVCCIRKFMIMNVCLILVCLGLLNTDGLAQGMSIDSGATNITIDYTAPMRQIDPMALGMDESGYFTPDVLVNDQLEQKRLRTLGVKYMRMHLIYRTPGNPGSTIVCGGDGCDQRWTGDQWIRAIEGIGATPVIEVPYLLADAVNLVRHFNHGSSPHVMYWIIGNEPDLHGISASNYSGMFNRDYDAMKAIDPSIHIGGGTTAWYDQDFLRTFLHLSGSRVDFVDFHGYAQQGNVSGNPAALLQHVAQYGANLQDLRSLLQSIVPARNTHIGMEVGEWELNWGGKAQNDTPLHTAWVASALGNILRAGGWSLFYADKGNALYGTAQTVKVASGHAVSVQLDDPGPAYHGLGMFTGEGLFQGFGSTMVTTSTTLPAIDVFASDHPRDIVIVDKNLTQAHTAVVALRGVTSGRITVWRKDQSAPFANPPVKLGTIQIQNGSFTYPLLPLSVTTFVLQAES
jgi:hypothetical protein